MRPRAACFAATPVVAFALAARPAVAPAQTARPRPGARPAAAADSLRFPTGRYTLSITRAELPTPVAHLAGDWALRFDPDGRFELMYLTTTGPRSLGVGRYATAGRRLTISGDGNSGVSCALVDANAATGEYTWEVRGPQLVLHLVKDDCMGRRSGLVHPWTRAPDTPAAAAGTAPPRR